MGIKKWKEKSAGMEWRSRGGEGRKEEKLRSWSKGERELLGKNEEGGREENGDKGKLEKGGKGKRRAVRERQGKAEVTKGSGESLEM